MHKYTQTHTHTVFNFEINLDIFHSSPLFLPLEVVVAIRAEMLSP